MPQPQTAVVDATRDATGTVWHQIKTAYGLPDLVGEARAAGVDLTPGRPNLYADPVYKLFGVHNAPAVKISAAYFEHQRPLLPADRAHCVDLMLTKAAQFFGIGPDVDGIRAAVKAGQAAAGGALADEDYALVWVADESDVKERQYPLRNPAEVKAAADYLRANRQHFTYLDRRTYAEKVLRKAAALGCPEADDPFLERTAGRGTCSAETTARELAKRAHQLRSQQRMPGLQENLVVQARSLLQKTADAHLPSNLVKVAELLDTLDRRFGLAQTNGFPEDVLFVITEKTAGAVARDHVALKSGAVYRLDDVTRLPMAEVKKAMGDGFARDCGLAGMWIHRDKAASYLPTLPAKDAALFEKAAAALGVHPSYRQPGGRALVLEPEVAADLAGAPA